MINELTSVAQAAANACTTTSTPASCQPGWLDTGSNSWQLTAATFVGLMSVPGLACPLRRAGPEEVGREHDVHGLHRVLGRAGRVGAVGLQDGLRLADRRRLRPTISNFTYGGNFFNNFFYNFVGHPETSLDGRWRDSQAQLSANGGTSLPLTQANDSAVLLPVRLRRHHPAAVPGQRARTHQGQGLDDLRPAVDDVRLRRQRDADLGRRLLGTRRRCRLLRRLRHPPRRRHQRFRRGLGHRPATGTRPGSDSFRTACR